MSLEFLAKIDVLYQHFQAHDQAYSDRLSRYRNIEPESAELLNVLIRTQQSKRILEIGTSTGYSTLWLAHAAESTSAKITTLEIDAERSELAHQNAVDFSLDCFVEFLVSDAQDYLRQTTEKFDFILLDAERDAYCDYWNYLPQILKEKGGLLVVDNVVSHESEVNDFVKLVRENPKFSTTTLSVGAGLFLATHS
ncbi:class I SAM-dependent methyltransferase [Acinetobacter faecalis]|uniref:O-methyltransferase n=1 Tax=Acinetobacter faecalis TaxID=2665161 RepID=UPI002A90A4BF|nr:class I SAM-dependent methyltransferase [Acinetobacter faecalis]MDY6458058.1 class I SAM-dependent methyltransferase [Acinetobacter faecalis]MDY6467564.1 class I SAM-dependent methyltransferase [Acinetobacter faecalis]